MRKQIIGSASKIANYLGFLDTYALFRRKLTKYQIAIFMYHRVGPKNDNWSLESLSVDSFKHQIEDFGRKSEIISLETLAKCLLDGKSPPQKAVVITFDDGYYDNYAYAFPILKMHKAPATIFLTTGHISSDKLFWWDKVGYVIQNTTLKSIETIDLGSYSLRTAKDKLEAQNKISEILKTFQEDMKSLIIEKLVDSSGVSIPHGLGEKMFLTWDNVKEMYHAGISFGAHTVNHPLLTRIPLERAKWEISQSKKDIENNLGIEVRTFSYPNGDYDSSLTDFFKETGFVSAVTTLPYHLIKPQDNVFTLSRIKMTQFDNEYKLAYSGFQEDFKKIFKQNN